MRDERVDTDVDPFALAAARRRRLLRLLFPLLTALLLIAAIVLITVYTERVNRRDALALTEEVVRAVEETVRLEVEAYLTPTATAVRLLADAAAAGIVGTLPADRALERQMRAVMAATPELASIFVGDDEGDFLMVQRSDGRLRTKLIDANGAGRVVRWIERDPAGHVFATRLDPDDRYDPRERPWFAAAQAGEGLVWSDVYRFFTTGAPGLTASLAAVARDAPPAVVGADLEIAEIGRFLAGLRIGERGRAVITALDGSLVAYPPDLSPRDFEDVPAVVEIDDAVLAEAFQRFRINRGERGVVVIDGVRHLTSAVSLADLVGREWWALLVVPEEAFIGFVAANARTSLALSGLVVLLATVVAGLLTLQGLQSDARAARASRSEEAVRAQGDTLEALADVEGLADPDDAPSLRRFATVVADAFAARRASVWRLNAARTSLACLETYDRERGAHTAAATLRAGHLGDAWPWLAGARPFTTAAGDDAGELRPLHAVYLDGVGTERLAVRPIVTGGRALGALWLEDADEGRVGPTAPALERLMARLLAPRLEALARADRGEAVAPAGTVAEAPVSLLARRERRLLRELAPAGGIEAVAPALVPRLAVVELRLGDDVALARSDAAGGDTALVRLSKVARREAGRVGIRHWVLRGDRLVAAAEVGVDAESGAAATRAVADFALALQPACREVARAGGVRAAFGAGIDVGPAFVAVGDDGGCRLWGEACRLAARMAESAPATAIQSTEAAYAHLAPDYLLRRRGSFFLDEVGEIATYILAGRL